MRAPQTQLRPPESETGRLWIGGRRGLIVAAGVLAIGGLVLGWPWLTAAGLAPIILLLVPCLAMCGLGLCMRGPRQAGDAAGAKIDAANSNSSDPPSRHGATMKGQEHA